MRCQQWILQLVDSKEHLLVLWENGTNDWASRLQRATHGQNNIPNEIYLEGSAPKDVKDDKLLMFDLYKKMLDS